MNATTVHSRRSEKAIEDCPSLTVDEVSQVLERYGVAVVQPRLRQHTARRRSAIVDLANGALFVKRHDRRMRTVTQLEEEHEFMSHLYAQGASVSRVLRSVDGHSAICVGDWTYEVHEVAAGVDLYRDAPSWPVFRSYGHAVSAGRALALLHGAARHYHAPARSRVSGYHVIAAADLTAVIRCYVRERPALGEYFRQRDWENDIARAIVPFHRAFVGMVPHGTPLWTHNDWQASNLLWSDSSAVAAVRTVLDFGSSDRTTAVYDLAAAIVRNTIPWRDIQEGRAAAADLTLVNGLLKGYFSGAKLTDGERAAVVAILPLVHVEHALTEIEYLHGIAHSARNVALAYHAFLLGHADWFAQPNGQALLNHLRRELEKAS